MSYRISQEYALSSVLEHDLSGPRCAFSYSDLQFYENRKAQRILITLAVRLQRREPLSRWEDATSLNISDIGIRLAVREPSRVGSNVRLHFDLPRTGRRLRIDGTIVWTRPRENFCGPSQCGIVFDNLKKVHENEKLLYFMDDRMCDLVLRSTPRDIECRPAQTLDELKTAFRIAYREYLLRGYCEKHDSNMHYSAFCLLPSSRTFVLKRKKTILGTISLIGDSPCGLPTESTFPDLVGKFRWGGRRLAEVSLLTLDDRAFRGKSLRLANFHKLTGSFWLFKTMLDYARHVAGVTDLVITIHPKHEKLYRNLAFKPIGQPASYALAGGNPGLPMHLDIPELERHLPSGRYFKQFFFDKRLPLDLLTKSYGWTPDAVRELLMKKWTSWRGTAKAPVEYLKRRYPEIQIPKANQPLR